MAKSEMGYKFLCSIFKIIYKDPDKKMQFGKYALSGNAMDPNEANQTFSEWAEFATGSICENRILSVRHNDISGESDLIKVLGSYCGEEIAEKISNYLGDLQNLADKNKDTEKSWRIKFHNILVKQNGPMPEMLAGISLTLSLGAGFQKNKNIFIGWREARQILTASLNVLGITHAEFIPEKQFRFIGSHIPGDFQRLLFLSVYNALRGLYPHKQTQMSQNLNSGKQVIKKLIAEGRSQDLYESLKQVDEAAKICDVMWKVLQKENEEEEFPNGRRLLLKDFYMIPSFEPMDEICYAEILRCDNGHRVRSLVIGNEGSGKTLLTKAVIMSCLCADEDVFRKFAARLGIDGRRYIPLLIDCKKIQEEENFEHLDFIQTGLKQMKQMVRHSESRKYLIHWEQCECYIMEYCRQKAERSELLLILDDLSSIKSKNYLDIIHNLERLGDLYPGLHILITSQRFSKSIMNEFWDYNKVEITPLSGNLEENIVKLVNMGLGWAEPEFYLEQLYANRYVQRYLDTPERLIKYLCYEFGDSFDVEELLLETIEEKLEYHSGEEISDCDCREFLKNLAVTITENKGRSKIKKSAELFQDRQAIPRNILNKQFFDGLKGELENPDQIWKYICDELILICPSDSINSFMFSNRLFYLSLAADFYLELLVEQPESLLNRFNAISAEEFSYIIVMMMNRLCRLYGNCGNRKAEVTEYHIFLLIQSIAAYVISKNDVNDIYQSLLALNEILYNKKLEDAFTYFHEDSRRMNCWNILKRSYMESYQHFMKLSDDTFLIEKIHIPEYMIG